MSFRRTQPIHLPRGLRTLTTTTLIAGCIFISEIGLRVPPTWKASFPVVARAMSTKPATPLRILAFGDSLTAGMSPPNYQDFPYASHLESSLQSRLFGGTRGDIVVKHRGYPGWTAEELLEESDAAGGLKTTISKESGGFDIVILLVGTNDVGHQRKVSETFESIRRLHELCHIEQVKRTIAIGIPMTGYQSMNQDIANVNKRLQEYCGRNDSKVQYFPFPFEWSPNSEYYCHDQLHFSPKGYQVLGESLVPVIETLFEAQYLNKA